MTVVRKRIADSLLELVGETPMLRLNRLCKDVESEILVKLEYLNPSGSMKDRMALGMVETAELDGRIVPGKSVISCASSGNTAQAVAMVCAIKGYRVKIRVPETSGLPEKIRPLERYGAEVEIMAMDDDRSDSLAREHGLHGATIEIPGRVRCLEEEKESPDHYWVRQFSNPANVHAQSRIGGEILEQTQGRLDIFIAAVGTGGTFLGVAKVLKEAVRSVRCVAVQPSRGEGWVDPLSPEKQYIPEISGGLVQEIRDSGIADDIVFVSNDAAREMAYRLSREEGLYCGMSTGAQVHVALEEAAKSKKAVTIVTSIVDRGDRHISDERFVT